ncbi:MAG: hypothetical protein ACREGB_04430 [Candidatus Saccharimonadales bacterium]
MNPAQPGGPLPSPTPDQSQAPAPIPGPASSNSPYEFIMNPQKPSRKPVALVGGNPMLQRVAIVVGILAIVVIAGAVLSSVLSAGSKEKTAGLLAVAQQQTELIHVATDGANNTTTLPMQNLAQNVLAAVTSDNNALLDYMSKNKQKVTPQLLAATQSKTIDASLKSAQENNTYDSTFKDIVQTELNDYAIALQKAYKDGLGSKGKALLAKQFDSTKALLAASNN